MFKNSIFIISMIIAEFMLYEGDLFELESQYTGLVFLTYNVVTSIPVVFYILCRPEVWEESIYKSKDPNKLIKLEYITDRRVVTQFFRSVFISALITILNYSFLQSNVIENIFFSILTSCVVASGCYQLFIGKCLLILR